MADKKEHSFSALPVADFTNHGPRHHSWITALTSTKPRDGPKPLSIQAVTTNELGLPMQVKAVSQVYQLGQDMGS